MIMFLPVLLKMRNVSDKNFRRNQNTHFKFSDADPSPLSSDVKKE